jgi:cell wall-associated NlpC family hydrolase
VQRVRRLASAPPLLVVLLVAACSSLRAPPPVFDPGAGAAIAATARALVGTPYHFGGADAAGFDCSGLALYVHERAGVSIPRTAREQQKAARPVTLDALLPGDLVFFHMHARGIDHVGIYVGDGRFVHAPRAGLKVTYAQLDHGYYAHRLVSAGRFWQGAGTRG